MAKRLIVIALTLIVCGASLTAMSQRTSPSAQAMAVSEINFAPLHRQASAALDNLRNLRERREASAGPAAAF